MKTTREGRRFILATFLIAFAAVNTGNNLIYLILALMLSFIALSILILRMNLSSLKLALSIETPVFAGERSAASFSLTNSKRLLPTYSVYVHSPDINIRTYFPFIPPKTSASNREYPVFLRRGLYSCGNFTLSSSFPYILFTGSQPLKTTGQILVYPQLREVEDIVSAITGTDEGEALRMLGTGEELYAIREFRYGDDWRKVHWKASARTSTLLMKEYAHYEMKKVSLLLDNLHPPDPENFEKAVSLAASLTKYFLDRGFPVRLLAARKVIPFGTGTEHLYTVLDILAVIREEEVWDSPPAYNTEGFTVLVLKSPASPLSRLGQDSDMVIYADSL